MENVSSSPPTPPPADGEDVSISPPSPWGQTPVCKKGLWGIYGVVVSLVSGYILIPLLVANGMELANPFLSPIHQLLLQQIVTIVSWLAIFALLGQHFGWKSLLGELGLRRERKWGYYGLEALRLLIVTTSLTLTCSYVWAYLQEHYPQWNLGNEPYRQFDKPEIVAITLFAVLTAPLLEEIIFRGFLQSTLHRTLNPVRAVLLTCMIFLLFHATYFDNVKAITHVVLLGLCFGIWRERTGSLIPGISVHLLNNIVASVMMIAR